MQNIEMYFPRKIYIVSEPNEFLSHLCINAQALSLDFCYPEDVKTGQNRVLVYYYM